MLEKQLTALLVPHLALYLRGLNEEQLRVSLWSGEVVLHNVELQPNLLSDGLVRLGVQLPVSLARAVISTLRISVPWTTLDSEPVGISVEGVDIVCVPIRAAPYDPAEDDATARRHTATALELFEETRAEYSGDAAPTAAASSIAAASTSAGGASSSSTTATGASTTTDASAASSAPGTASASATASNGGGGGTSMRYVASLLAVIQRNVQLSIRDLSVSFDFSYDGLDPSFRYAVRLFVAEAFMCTTDEEWRPRFVSDPQANATTHRTLAVEGVTVSVVVPTHAGPEEQTVLRDLRLSFFTAMGEAPGGPINVLLRTMPVDASFSLAAARVVVWWLRYMDEGRSHAAWRKHFVQPSLDTSVGTSSGQGAGGTASAPRSAQRLSRLPSSSLLSAEAAAAARRHSTARVPARQRWAMTASAILDMVRQRLQGWRWAAMSTFAIRRRAYVALHKRRQGAPWLPALTAAETEECATAEAQLTLPQVVFLRCVAYAELSDEAWRRQQERGLIATATRRVAATAAAAAAGAATNGHGVEAMRANAAIAAAVAADSGAAVSDEWDVDDPPGGAGDAASSAASGSWASWLNPAAYWRGGGGSAAGAAGAAAGATGATGAGNGSKRATLTRAARLPQVSVREALRSELRAADVFLAHPVWLAVKMMPRRRTEGPSPLRLVIDIPTFGVVLTGTAPRAAIVVSVNAVAVTVDTSHDTMCHASIGDIEISALLPTSSGASMLGDEAVRRRPLLTTLSPHGLGNGHPVFFGGAASSLMGQSPTAAGPGPVAPTAASVAASATSTGVLGRLGSLLSLGRRKGASPLRSDAPPPLPPQGGGATTSGGASTHPPAAHGRSCVFAVAVDARGCIRAVLQGCRLTADRAVAAYWANEWERHDVVGVGASVPVRRDEPSRSGTRRAAAPLAVVGPAPPAGRTIDVGIAGCEVFVPLHAPCPAKGVAGPPVLSLLIAEAAAHMVVGGLAPTGPSATVPASGEASNPSTGLLTSSGDPEPPAMVVSVEASGVAVVLMQPTALPPLPSGGGASPATATTRNDSHPSSPSGEAETPSLAFVETRDGLHAARAGFTAATPGRPTQQGGLWGTSTSSPSEGDACEILALPRLLVHVESAVDADALLPRSTGPKPPVYAVDVTIPEGLSVRASPAAVACLVQGLLQPPAPADTPDMAVWMGDASRLTAASTADPTSLGFAACGFSQFCALCERDGFTVGRVASFDATQRSLSSTRPAVHSSFSAASGTNGGWVIVDLMATASSTDGPVSTPAVRQLALGSANPAVIDMWAAALHSAVVRGAPASASAASAAASSRSASTGATAANDTDVRTASSSPGIGLPSATPTRRHFSVAVRFTGGTGASVAVYDDAAARALTSDGRFDALPIGHVTLAAGTSIQADIDAATSAPTVIAIAVPMLTIVGVAAGYPPATSGHDVSGDAAAAGHRWAVVDGLEIRVASPVAEGRTAVTIGMGGATALVHSSLAQSAEFLYGVFVSVTRSPMPARFLASPPAPASLHVRVTAARQLSVTLHDADGSPTAEATLQGLSVAMTDTPSVGQFVQVSLCVTRAVRCRAVSATAAAAAAAAADVPLAMRFAPLLQPRPVAAGETPAAGVDVAVEYRTFPTRAAALAANRRGFDAAVRVRIRDAVLTYQHNFISRLTSITTADPAVSRLVRMTRHPGFYVSLLAAARAASNEGRPDPSVTQMALDVQLDACDVHIPIEPDGAVTTAPSDGLMFVVERIAVSNAFGAAPRVGATESASGDASSLVSTLAPALTTNVVLTNLRDPVKGITVAPSIHVRVSAPLVAPSLATFDANEKSSLASSAAAAVGPWQHIGVSIGELRAELSVEEFNALLAIAARNILEPVGPAVAASGALVSTALELGVDRMQITVFSAATQLALTGALLKVEKRGGGMFALAPSTVLQVFSVTADCRVTTSGAHALHSNHHHHHQHHHHKPAHQKHDGDGAAALPPRDSWRRLASVRSISANVVSHRTQELPLAAIHGAISGLDVTPNVIGIFAARDLLFNNHSIVSLDTILNAPPSPLPPAAVARLAEIRAAATTTTNSQQQQPSSTVVVVVQRVHMVFSDWTVRLEEPWGEAIAVATLAAATLDTQASADGAMSVALRCGPSGVVLRQLVEPLALEAYPTMLVSLPPASATLDDSGVPTDSPVGDAASPLELFIHLPGRASLSTIAQTTPPSIVFTTHVECRASGVRVVMLPHVWLRLVNLATVELLSLSSIMLQPAERARREANPSAEATRIVVSASRIEIAIPQSLDASSPAWSAVVPSLTVSNTLERYTPTSVAPGPPTIAASAAVGLTGTAASAWAERYTVVISGLDVFPMTAESVKTTTVVIVKPISRTVPVGCRFAMTIDVTVGVPPQAAAGGAGAAANDAPTMASPPTFTCHALVTKNLLRQAEHVVALAGLIKSIPYYQQPRGADMLLFVRVPHLRADVVAAPPLMEMGSNPSSATTRYLGEGTVLLQARASVVVAYSQEFGCRDSTVQAAVEGLVLTEAQSGAVLLRPSVAAGSQTSSLVIRIAAGDGTVAIAARGHCALLEGRLVAAAAQLDAAFGSESEGIADAAAAHAQPVLPPQAAAAVSAPSAASSASGSAVTSAATTAPPQQHTIAISASECEIEVPGVAALRCGALSVHHRNGASSTVVETEFVSLVRLSDCAAALSARRATCELRRGEVDVAVQHLAYTHDPMLLLDVGRAAVALSDYVSKHVRLSRKPEESFKQTVTISVEHATFRLLASVTGNTASQERGVPLLASSSSSSALAAPSHPAGAAVVALTLPALVVVVERTTAAVAGRVDALDGRVTLDVAATGARYALAGDIDVAINAPLPGEVHVRLGRPTRFVLPANGDAAWVAQAASEATRPLLSAGPLFVDSSSSSSSATVGSDLSPSGAPGSSHGKASTTNVGSHHGAPSEGARPTEGADPSPGGGSVGSHRRFVFEAPLIGFAVGTSVGVDLRGVHVESSADAERTTTALRVADITSHTNATLGLQRAPPVVVRPTADAGSIGGSRFAVFLRRTEYAPLVVGPLGSPAHCGTTVQFGVSSVTLSAALLAFVHRSVLAPVATGVRRAAEATASRIAASTGGMNAATFLRGAAPLRVVTFSDDATLVDDLVIGPGTILHFAGGHRNVIRLRGSNRARLVLCRNRGASDSSASNSSSTLGGRNASAGRPYAPRPSPRHPFGGAPIVVDDGVSVYLQSLPLVLTDVSPSEAPLGGRGGAALCGFVCLRGPHALFHTEAPSVACVWQRAPASTSGRIRGAGSLAVPMPPSMPLAGGITASSSSSTHVDPNTAASASVAGLAGGASAGVVASGSSTTGISGNLNSTGGGSGTPPQNTVLTREWSLSLQLEVTLCEGGRRLALSCGVSGAYRQHTGSSGGVLSEVGDFALSRVEMLCDGGRVTARPTGAELSVRHHALSGSVPGCGAVSIPNGVNGINGGESRHHDDAPSVGLTSVRFIVSDISASLTRSHCTLLHAVASSLAIAAAELGSIAGDVAADGPTAPLTRLAPSTLLAPLGNEEQGGARPACGDETSRFVWPLIATTSVPPSGTARALTGCVIGGFADPLAAVSFASGSSHRGGGSSSNGTIGMDGATSAVAAADGAGDDCVGRFDAAINCPSVCLQLTTDLYVPLLRLDISSASYQARGPRSFDDVNVACAASIAAWENISASTSVARRGVFSASSAILVGGGWKPLLSTAPQLTLEWRTLAGGAVSIDGEVSFGALSMNVPVVAVPRLLAAVSTPSAGYRVVNHTGCALSLTGAAGAQIVPAGPVGTGTTVALTVCAVESTMLYVSLAPEAGPAQSASTGGEATAGETDALVAATSAAALRGVAAVDVGRLSSPAGGGFGQRRRSSSVAGGSSEQDPPLTSGNTALLRLDADVLVLLTVDTEDETVTLSAPIRVFNGCDTALWIPTDAATAITGGNGAAPFATSHHNPPSQTPATPSASNTVPTSSVHAGATAKPATSAPAVLNVPPFSTRALSIGLMGLPLRFSMAPGLVPVTADEGASLRGNSSLSSSPGIAHDGFPGAASLSALFVVAHALAGCIDCDAAPTSGGKHDHSNKKTQPGGASQRRVPDRRVLLRDPSTGATRAVVCRVLVDRASGAVTLAVLPVLRVRNDTGVPIDIASIGGIPEDTPPVPGNASSPIAVDLQRPSQQQRSTSVIPPGGFRCFYGLPAGHEAQLRVSVWLAPSEQDVWMAPATNGAPTAMLSNGRNGHLLSFNGSRVPWSDAACTSVSTTAAETPAPFAVTLYPTQGPLTSSGNSVADPRAPVALHDGPSAMAAAAGPLTARFAAAVDASGPCWALSVPALLQSELTFPVAVFEANGCPLPGQSLRPSAPVPLGHDVRGGVRGVDRTTPLSLCFAAVPTRDGRPCVAPEDRSGTVAILPGSTTAVTCRLTRLLPQTPHGDGSSHSPDAVFCGVPGVETAVTFFVQHRGRPGVVATAPTSNDATPAAVLPTSVPPALISLRPRWVVRNSGTRTPLLFSIDGFPDEESFVLAPGEARGIVKLPASVASNPEVRVRPFVASATAHQQHQWMWSNSIPLARQASSSAVATIAIRQAPIATGSTAVVAATATLVRPANPVVAHASSSSSAAFAGTPVFVADVSSLGDKRPAIGVVFCALRVRPFFRGEQVESHFDVDAGRPAIVLANRTSKPATAQAPSALMRFAIPPFTSVPVCAFGWKEAVAGGLTVSIEDAQLSLLLPRASAEGTGQAIGKTGVSALTVFDPSSELHVVSLCSDRALEAASLPRGMRVVNASLFVQTLEVTATIPSDVGAFCGGASDDDDDASDNDTNDEANRVPSNGTPPNSRDKETGGRRLPATRELAVLSLVALAATVCDNGDRLLITLRCSEISIEDRLRVKSKTGGQGSGDGTGDDVTAAHGASDSNAVPLVFLCNDADGVRKSESDEGAEAIDLALHLRRSPVASVVHIVGAGLKLGHITVSLRDEFLWSLRRVYAAVAAQQQGQRNRTNSAAIAGSTGSDEIAGAATGAALDTLDAGQPRTTNDGRIGKRPKGELRFLIEQAAMDRIRYDVSLRRRSDGRYDPFADFLPFGSSFFLSSVDRFSDVVDSVAIVGLFSPKSALVAAAVASLKSGMFRKAVRLVLSLEALGNPLGLVASVASGVKDFVVETATLHPVQGVRSLALSAAAGSLHSVSLLARVAGRGVARAGLDRRWLRQRADEAAAGRPPPGLLRSVGRGVLGGVTGIVTQPWEGARKGGVLGFCLGIGLGVAGVVVRPVAGLLDGVGASAAAGVDAIASVRDSSGGRTAAALRPPIRGSFAQPQRITEGGGGGGGGGSAAASTTTPTLVRHGSGANGPSFAGSDVGSRVATDGGNGSALHSRTPSGGSMGGLSPAAAVFNDSPSASNINSNNNNNMSSNGAVVVSSSGVAGGNSAVSGAARLLAVCPSVPVDPAAAAALPSSKVCAALRRRVGDAAYPRALCDAYGPGALALHASWSEFFAATTDVEFGEWAALARDVHVARGLAAFAANGATSSGVFEAGAAAALRSSRAAPPVPTDPAKALAAVSGLARAFHLKRTLGPLEASRFVPLEELVAVCSWAELRRCFSPADFKHHAAPIALRRWEGAWNIGTTTEAEGAS